MLSLPLTPLLILFASALSQPEPQEPTNKADEAEAGEAQQRPTQLHSRPQDPAQLCKASCGDRLCELVEFYGFTPDSSTLGYAVVKCPGSTGIGGEPRRFFYMRTIHGSLGRQRLEERRLTGVNFIKHFNSHGFTHSPLEVVQGDDDAKTVVVPGKASVSVALKVARTMELEIAARKQEETLFSTSLPLSEIYIRMGAAAWLAPDGKRLFIAVLLDAEFRVDHWVGCFSVQ